LSFKTRSLRGDKDKHRCTGQKKNWAWEKVGTTWSNFVFSRFLLLACLWYGHKSKRCGYGPFHTERPVTARQRGHATEIHATETRMEIGNVNAKGKGTRTGTGTDRD